MTRGRKPLPPNVHRLRGNPSKLSAAQLNGTDDVNPTVEIPTPPTRLVGEALAEWARITRELEALGLIAQVDMVGLVVYCENWATFELASAKLAELNGELVIRHPNGFSGASPWLGIRDRAAEACRRQMTEFGLSPSARTRVKSTRQLELFDDDSINRFFK